MNQLIPRLYLNCEGLAMFLGGDTQARVFLVVCEQPGSLRSILRTYNTLYDPIAYTTVATIANKLVDKGILCRKRLPGLKVEYTYATEYTEDELIATCVDMILKALIEEYPEYIKAGLSLLPGVQIDV